MFTTTHGLCSAGDQTWALYMLVSSLPMEQIPPSKMFPLTPELLDPVM